MRTRFIPDNILQGKRIANLIKPRNLIEGGLWCIFIAYIFFKIPFAPLFRWIMIIVLGIVMLILNCIGIKNLSFSEAVINYIKIRRHTKQIHYRRTNNVIKEGKPIIKDGYVTSQKEAITSTWYKRFTQK